MRLDTWLNIACLFKTRSQAARAIDLGRVRVRGERVKPHRTVQIGDRLEIDRGEAVQHVVIREVTEGNVSRKDARRLYEDVTPEPTQEELEIRRVDRMMRLRYEGKGRPSRKDLERLRKIKGTT
ncbi:MAG TPA: S4 domain-containing protein [Thermoanaerobaculia bacterium]|nr:S4 domain-containing protein [Thermoanaerobaculia bacterium]HUM29535.1 S4 domain-containing protein [Thermoanaerobaculia bacterium]HXK67918.1 S4 domain-containing protein [Thermoanaerobaculia bacterium]